MSAITLFDLNGEQRFTGTSVGGGGARPFISDTETGIVVNRAGGFVSAWETFDLEEPGVGYGKMVATAAVADSETWGTTISPFLEVAVSVDGVAWVGLYDLSGASFAGVIFIDRSGITAPNPVGAPIAYTVFTPRLIRFRLAIQDVNSGMVYAGANSPSFTATFDYTAS